MVTGTAKWEKHRTLSLINSLIKFLATKLVLRVIINRIQDRTLTEIATVQYRFMSDRRTKNAVFVPRRLVERSIEKQKDMFLSLITERCLIL